MDKTYSPQNIEQPIYKSWEKNHNFEPQGNGKTYCIMLPPPNVTGSLHMGHGFQHTLIDILIRYKRMLGYQTLWQPGTDHAGISTQLIVEAQLEKQGLHRSNMSREEFLQHSWQWKEKSGNHITQQMRRIGSSPDWSKERFTMDDGLSAAVQKVFIQLYDEDLIYRGTRLVNWDPVLGTAVSDLEVISSEEKGFIWHIRYPIVDSNEYITVATTRPETMFGDAAIAVHPDDERYKHLIGKSIIIPISERIIPIIADTYVDPSFGTGCVKITPAHDFNDHEVGKRHNLENLNIFDKTAKLNENAPKKYQTLDRFVARKLLVDELEQHEYLEKVEPHILKIPRGEKSNTIIEPLLTEQWYVKTKPLAQPAIEAVKNGQIRFIPEQWNKTYFHWMENIEDWCISRQLWWGHRIPAWYDDAGNVFVGYSENDVRFKYKIKDTTILKQDEDVLDTWFSSALWPFSTLGWPQRTPEFEKFYPTSALVTGFDILFFWVARMIMMSLKFTGKIPFKDVIITGLICDHEGKKMSKSKGNVLDPIDIIDGISLEQLLKKRTDHLVLNSVRNSIEKATKQQFPDGIAAFGTDALRFTYCSLPANTRQVKFDLQRVEGYRNFCNKLWNATRFVLMMTADDANDLDEGALQYSPADLWINSKLQKTIALCEEHLQQYRFDLLAQSLYDFVWHEYCDWYVEFSKTVILNPKTHAPIKRGTQRTLINILNQALKLLHPIIPFITEDLWSKIKYLTSDTASSLMLCAYPKIDNNFINNTIEEEIEWVKNIIISIRTIRSEMLVSPSKQTPLYLRNFNPAIEKLVAKYSTILSALGKLTSINLLNPNDPVPLASSNVVGELELLIPMAGVIDQAAELQRLDKEIAKIEKDLIFTYNKLNNPSFTDNAPPDVIEKTKEKLEQAEQAKQKLSVYQEKIRCLSN
jgi:valyl-tRNA synthetase